MKPTRSSAFTLIELLVVIAIIAILAAILFPVFAQAKVAAKKAMALSDMKQMMLGHMLYTDDSDDVYSPRFRGGYGPRGNGPDPTDGMSWDKLIQGYVKNYEIMTSKMDDRAKYKTPYGQLRRGYDVARNVFSGVQIRPGFMGDYNPNKKSSLSTTAVPLPAETIAIGEARQSLINNQDPWTADQWVLPMGIENTRKLEWENKNDPRAPYGNISNRYSNGSVWGFCDGHVKYVRVNGAASDGVQQGTVFPGYEQKAGAWVGGNGDPFWDKGISCLDSLATAGTAQCKLPGE